jgi:hypothetical protein
MHFDPKVRWKLSSILDAFKENRCTPIAEKYIAKNLLTFIKRMTFPEFKEMTQNTDFEVMKPFHARLVKNFPPPTYAPECYLNVINKMKHKEWDYVTRLFNADSKDSPLIVKLFTKFAALDYFEDALIGQTKLSKEKMIEEMKTIFGKNIFDSEHLGKTHLQKRINDWDKVVHSRGFKLFQSEEKSVDTPQAVKQFKK